MVAAHITAELLIVEKMDIIFAETAVKAQAVDADKKVEAINTLNYVILKGLKILQACLA